MPADDCAFGRDNFATPVAIAATRFDKFAVMARRDETDFLVDGQSTMNAEGRWQGQADPPLSRAGVAQALELAALLESDVRRLLAAGGESAGGEELTAEQWLAQVALFSSDLQRAAETARLLGEAT